MEIALLFCGGIFLAAIIFVVLVYNRLIVLRNNREQAFSDVDVQMKQRYDLVPNLVNTVKGYAAHEKTLLEDIAKTRTAAMNAGSMDEKIAAENQFTGVLRNLFAVAENYPDLKANQNFLQLQTELSDLENKIAAARRFFNNATKEYNSSLQTFPTNLFAGIFGFKQSVFFELGSEKEQAEKPVAVKL